MNKIFTIAKYTLKENISNKVFNGVIMFGGLLIFFTMLLDKIALYEGAKVIRDSGLFLIEFFVLLIAVYTSSTYIIRDQKEKSIYLVLTKAVSKSMYLTGTALGLMLAVLFNVIIMGSLLGGVLFFKGAVLDMDFFNSLLFIAYKLFILVGIGVFFSVISESYISSIIFTISTYATGHAVAELKIIAGQLAGTAYAYILDFLYLVLPKFHLLNYKDHLKDIQADSFQMFLYTLSYTVCVMFLANIIFSKKRL